MANELKRPPAAEGRERLRGIAGGGGVSDVELLRGAGRDPDVFRDFYERYSERSSATSGDGPPTGTRHWN